MNFFDMERKKHRLVKITNKLSADHNNVFCHSLLQDW